MNVTGGLKEVLHPDKMRDQGGRTDPIFERLQHSQKIAKIGCFELDVTSGSFFTSTPVYLSEEQCRILGYEADTTALAPELFFKHILPADKPRLSAAMNKAIHGNTEVDIEYRILMDNGDIEHVWLRGDVIADEDARRRKMVGIAQIITARKRKEEELTKVEKELKKLFESMSEVFFSINMETFELIQISPSCETVYGYAARDFRQSPDLWYRLILDKDKPLVDANNTAMYRGHAVMATYRIIHRDGSIRCLETRITPTLNEEGTLIRIDGATADITKRKEAERSVKATEDKFRSLIKNCADVIMVLSRNHEVLFASDSLYRVTGFTPEEALGLQSIQMVHPDDQPVLRARFEDVLNGAEGINFTYRRQKKDGSYIWCEGTATNLLDDPAVEGVVLIFRDISDRKEYEQALQASNEQLRKSNLELDRFVYSVSHDLRAPLLSVLGIINLAVEEEDAAAIKDYLAMMKGSVLKLDGFINDILDYSRNVRLEIKKEPVDFHSLLWEISANLKYMGGSRPVDIHTKIIDGPSFYSDKTRIAVILSNLVSNAIRYSNPDVDNPYVAIEVRHCPIEAVIIVKDNGIGIPTEFHAKIYDMFFRVSHQSEGSGLGLYLVKEAVSKLGGKIMFESAPGAGTEFTIVLPNLYPLEETEAAATSH